MTAKRISLFKDSVFGTISKKAQENNAVNLGQGFPDFDGPDFLKEYVIKEIQSGNNQYSPFPGSLRLRESVSSYYKSFYDLCFDPNHEISISVGATEGIYLSIQAVVDPGDEVIVMEPFYDSYVASIKMAGGIPKPITLKSPDFRIDYQALRESLSEKTKLIILNNPHNPTGRVFSREELKEFISVVKSHSCYLMSDEVYEFLTFDDFKHIPLGKFEDVKDRVITVSSAGKTFGVTGWKVGWVCANAEVSNAIRKLHQYITFCVATPLQDAFANAISNLNDYLPKFRSEYQKKRDDFYKGLSDIGFKFSPPEGTYFMMVPIPKSYQLKDVEFSLKLIEEFKVATIPPSSFYLKSQEGQNYVRFCFAKKEKTLSQALENLNGLEF